MAFAAFTEWKSVIVVLLPAISMICPGSFMEEAIAAFLAWWMALQRISTPKQPMPRDEGVVYLPFQTVLTIKTRFPQIP